MSETKSKPNILTDFVLDEIPVEELLDLHNKTFSYDNSCDSGNSSLHLTPTPTKTAISYLTELCAKRGQILPVFIEDPYAANTSKFTFSYMVTVVDNNERKSCQGFGNCKKEAKHDAARKMYELITGRNLQAPLSAVIQPSRAAAPPTSISFNELITGRNLQAPLSEVIQPRAAAPPTSISFINLLLEEAVKKKYNMPTFSNQRSIGPPHMPIFEIDCDWREKRTTGTAKTKKLAKNHAAQLMWAKFT